MSWIQAKLEFGVCISEALLTSKTDIVRLYSVHDSAQAPAHGQIFLDWDEAAAAQAVKAQVVLDTYAEDGKVAYLESGRDCDCVEYSGRRHIVDATVHAYVDLDASISEWADGPYRLQLARVSETLHVEYECRDLVMEAYENGHPHHIVSSFA